MPQKRVTKTGKTTWVARYRDPAGKQRSKSFPTRREAKAYEDEQNRATRRGEWIDPRNAITLGELVQARMGMATRLTTRNTRVFAYKNLGELRDVPITKLKPSMMRAWLEQLRNGRPWAGNRALSASTVQSVAAIVHGALTQAVVDDMIVKHPMRGIKVRTNLLVEREDIPTMAEVGRIVDACYSTGVGRAANPQLARMIMFAVHTGLRSGEICGLKVSDVSMVGRFVRVERQTSQRTGEYVALKSESSRRVVPLSDVALGVVDAQIGFTGAGADGALFQSVSGRPFRSSDVGARFRVAAQVAGVETTFHALRHVFASRLLDGGLSVVQVQRLLGHASAVTTLGTYGHLVEGAEDAVHGVLRDWCGIDGGLGGGFGGVSAG